MRIISFLEMIGIAKRRLPQTIVEEISGKAATLKHRRCRVGLSPHAPYSTVPELLDLSARTARRRRWLICTHVAESALEYEMFARRRGEMFDWLARSGRDMTDCGHGSPVGHLERFGVLGPNLRGAAAATLVATGTLLLGLRGQSVVPIGPRQLRIVDRVDLGPRQAVVLVETAGRRYLVTTGASVTVLPPEGEG